MGEQKHDFVVINGIKIDKGLELLIEAVWAKGLKTEFCCEHLNDNKLDEEPIAHIIFSYASEAMYFTEMTCRAIWNDYGNPNPPRATSLAWAQSNVSMNPMLSLGGPTLRWSVEWSVDFTDRITDFWIGEVI